MPYTLFIAGDSTAALKGASEKPMTGWGEYLQSHFQSTISVDNRAINGRSTRSFLAERRLEHIEQDFKEGDYLFIQFGHNDGKCEDPLRYTDPNSDYRHHLQIMIESARQRGGTPVLLTSVSRRWYTADGTLDPENIGRYPAAMSELAVATHTPLLDIFRASKQLYASIGEEGTKSLFMHLPEQAHPNYPHGITDNTHFSDAGAQAIAKLVAEAIAQSPDLLDLKQHLR